MDFKELKAKLILPEGVKVIPGKDGKVIIIADPISSDTKLLMQNLNSMMGYNKTTTKLLNKILKESNTDHCQSSEDLQDSLDRIHELVKSHLKK